MMKQFISKQVADVKRLLPRQFGLWNLFLWLILWPLLIPCVIINVLLLREERYCDFTYSVWKVLSPHPIRSVLILTLVMNCCVLSTSLHYNDMVYCKTSPFARVGVRYDITNNLQARDGFTPLSSLTIHDIDYFYNYSAGESYFAFSIGFDGTFTTDKVCSLILVYNPSSRHLYAIPDLSWPFSHHFELTGHDRYLVTWLNQNGNMGTGQAVDLNVYDLRFGNKLTSFTFYEDIETVVGMEDILLVTLKSGTVIQANVDTSAVEALSSREAREAQAALNDLDEKGSTRPILEVERITLEEDEYQLYNHHYIVRYRLDFWERESPQ